MEKHQKEIAAIISTTRIGEESFLVDSQKAAKIIMQYITYHFQVKDTFNFQSDQVN